MDSLKNILLKARARFPRFSKRLDEAEALGRWDLAVGPAISRHATPCRVEEGILFVEVSHPIWRTELHHRKRQILAVLNDGRSGHDAAPGEKARSRLLPAKEILKDIIFIDPGKPGFTNSASSKPQARKKPQVRRARMQRS